MAVRAWAVITACAAAAAVEPVADMSVALMKGPFDVKSCEATAPNASWSNVLGCNMTNDAGVWRHASVWFGVFDVTGASPDARFALTLNIECLTPAGPTHSGSGGFPLRVSAFDDADWASTRPGAWGPACSDAYVARETARCAAAAAVAPIGCGPNVTVDVTAAVRCGRGAGSAVALLVSGECDVCFEVPDPGGGYYCSPAAPALATRGAPSPPRLTW